MDPSVPSPRVSQPCLQETCYWLFSLLSWVTQPFPLEVSGTSPWTASGKMGEQPAWGAVGAEPQLWPRYQGRHLPVQGCGAFLLCALGSLRFCLTEHPAGVQKQVVLPLTGGIAWPSWEAAAAGSQSLPSLAVAPNSGLRIAPPRFPMLHAEHGQGHIAL